MDIICTNCGNQLRASSVFCPACGEKAESPIATLEPVPEPAAEPATESPAKPGFPPKPPVIKTIARVVVSVLLGIPEFALAVALIALAAVRPGNASAIVENTNISLVMEEAGLDEVISSVVEALPDADVPVDITDVEDFLKRDTVSEEIGKIAEGYLNAAAKGELDYYISPEDVESFLKAITPDIQDHFDYDLTDEDVGTISDLLQESIDLSDYSVGKVLDDAKIDAALPGILLSMWQMVIAGILFVLVTFDIFLFHRKKVRNAFMATGIPVTLSGFASIIAGMLFGPFHDLLSNTPLEKLTRFTGGIALQFILYGIICLATGVVSLAVYAIIMRKREHYMLKTYQPAVTKVWRMAGLIANIAVFIICAAISLFLRAGLL